jgi:hypothetical protein
MIDIVQIPSVFESNSVALKSVAKDLIDGLKIVEKEQTYIIGNLALTEGVSPHKNINSAPSDLDYNLLLKAGLLIGKQKLPGSITVTTGFPFSTYQLYKDVAKDRILKEQVIDFDTTTFLNGSGSLRRLVVDVEKAFVMPEVVSCASALRKVDLVKGNFFMLSLGYGTFEAILSNEGGLVQRSAVSTFGLRYAIKLMENELLKTHYLDLKNEHQLDNAFRDGFIFLNRKKVDLVDLRKKVLAQYYADVISPALRKAFDDKDFAKTNVMYLAGGGALYKDIINEFNIEFNGIVDVVVADKAPYLAAIGYAYNSLVEAGGDKSKALGIDIGNNTTVVCSFADDNNN